MDTRTADFGEHNENMVAETAAVFHQPEVRSSEKENTATDVLATGMLYHAGIVVGFLSSSQYGEGVGFR
ncbi:hypothetical protein FACS189419_04860 [Planctomycetales bacterium]|nr:hypothetical protein FACS189419_04860 [Planctomycetales bacterium]